MKLRTLGAIVPMATATACLLLAPAAKSATVELGVRGNMTTTPPQYNWWNSVTLSSSESSWNGGYVYKNADGAGYVSAGTVDSYPNPYTWPMTFPYAGHTTVWYVEDYGYKPPSGYTVQGWTQSTNTVTLTTNPDGTYVINIP